MTKPKKPSVFARHEMAPEICPEATGGPSAETSDFMYEIESESDSGRNFDEESQETHEINSIYEYCSDDEAIIEKENAPYFVHDAALVVQKIRNNGIKTRVHLLNFIVDTSEYLINQSGSDPKYNVRKAELIEASRELKIGYRKLYDFIKLQEQDLFESLHGVLAGAFLIGLASDASGLSVSDAKKLAGSIFAANARKYARKAAEERAEKFTNIVRIAIPIAFQRHEILKKLSNSDQSAGILMPIVKELLNKYSKSEKECKEQEEKKGKEEKENSEKIGTNTIRQAIKRITGGKRGGIRKDSPEFRELLGQDTPV